MSGGLVAAGTRLSAFVTLVVVALALYVAAGLYKRCCAGVTCHDVLIALLPSHPRPVYDSLSLSLSLSLCVLLV